MADPEFHRNLRRQGGMVLLLVCDGELIGTTIDRLGMKFDLPTFPEPTDKELLAELLAVHGNANLFGTKVCDLVVEMGLVSRKAVKEIEGVPYLILI